MNRRMFMKKVGIGVGTTAVVTGLPLAMSEASRGVIVKRHVVKKFLRISRIASQFENLSGDSHEQVYKLYAGLLHIKNPPFHRVNELAREIEVKGITKVATWFMRQREFQSLTPIGADKIIYPKNSKKDVRFINVALERAAQIQRCYLTIAGRLPTHSELSETLVYLTQTNARRDKRVAVNYPKIEMNHAYAQGGTDGFSNPEAAALGGPAAAQVMGELSAQGLSEAEAAAAIAAIGAALALTESGATVAATGISLVGAAHAAGTIGLSFTSTAFAVSPTTFAVTTGLAGTALTITGLGMIGLGILVLVVVLPNIPGAFSSTPPSTNRGVDPAPTTGDPAAAPTAAPPATPPDFGPGINLDITQTHEAPPTVTVTDVPTVSEDESATAASVSESEGNGVSTSEGGAPGAPGSDGDGAGDGAGDGGGDGCKLLPIIAAAGKKLMEEKK